MGNKKPLGKQPYPIRPTLDMSESSQTEKWNQEGPLGSPPSIVGITKYRGYFFILKGAKKTRKSRPTNESEEGPKVKKKIREDH